MGVTVYIWKLQYINITYDAYIIGRGPKTKEEEESAVEGQLVHSASPFVSRYVSGVRGG